MPRDFFRLRDPFAVLQNQSELEQQLGSDLICDILFQPDEWHGTQKWNKIKGKKFENVSLSKTRIVGLQLLDCTFRDCLFIGTSFEDCEIQNCSFEGCNPYKIRFQRTYADPEQFAHMLDARKHSNIGVHLFQEMFRDSIQQEQREFASTAQFYFRRWKRYQLNYDRRSNRIGTSQWLGKWLPSVSFEYFAGFGLRSRYLIASASLAILALVCFNHLMWSNFGIIGPNGNEDTRRFVESFYFTLVTMTTIGFGDFVPTSVVGRSIVAIEGVIGLILLGLFGATAIRKFVR